MYIYSVQFPIKIFSVIILLFVFQVSCIAQFNLFEEKIFKQDSINKTWNREKIFVHYDRPSYKINDTLWFKGYVLNAADHAPDDSIGIAYVEVINEDNEVIKRLSSPCAWGYFFGRLTLTEHDFKQGSYVLRAYTNWMRNFGDSLFFESRFKLIDPASDEWNASIQQMTFSNNRFTLLAGITLKNGSLSNKQIISIKLRRGNKNFLNLKLQTDTSGNFYVDTLLDLKVDPKNLVLQIADKENLIAAIPVKATGDKSIDLQFLPEGGSFVSGKQQVLAFKALNVYGKGTDVNGFIQDSKGNNIVSFASVLKGMGTILFTPQANEHYSALLSNGMSFSLPQAKASGTVLQIINNPVSDSIELKIDASPDLYGRSYYFAIETRGINYMRAQIKNLTKQFTFSVPKSLFPSGVARVTLYDENFNPLNERITFIWHDDALQLTCTSNKPFYQIKDSVGITINAKNFNGENTRGSFSIAVIDTSQVKVETAAENLLTYMMLGSDIKGEIEEPNYYFKNPQTSALEVLMLTQGWVQYNWNMGAPEFERERKFTITGKVSNTLNKPVSNTNITLFAREGNSGKFFLDTITNKEGLFQFNNFPYFTTDSLSIVLKALNKKNKDFGIGIDLNVPNYPEYNGNNFILPERNVLLDTTARQFVENYSRLTEQMKKDGGYLEDVVVTTRVKIQGSKNLNRNGGSDQVITEDILEKTPKKTLLNVLQENVKGFRMGTLPRSSLQQYFIGFSIIHFVIDGMDLDDFYYARNPEEVFYKFPSESTPFNDRLLFLQPYLTNLFADDIIGIEVMKSPKYSTTYRAGYLGMNEFIDHKIQPDTYAFIEITTHLGKGPFIMKVPGEYRYRPLVPVIAKSFYSPRYSSQKDEAAFPDMRSTVYWNPEVMTDDNGNANVSFYTSQSSSNYLIVLQGMDFRGGLGVLYKYLDIKDEKKTGVK